MRTFLDSLAKILDSFGFAKKSKNFLGFLSTILKDLENLANFAKNKCQDLGKKFLGKKTKTPTTGIRVFLNPAEKTVKLSLFFTPERSVKFHTHVHKLFVMNDKVDTSVQLSCQTLIELKHDDGNTDFTAKSPNQLQVHTIDVGIFSPPKKLQTLYKKSIPSFGPEQVNHN